jgi:ribosomal protein L34E
MLDSKRQHLKTPARNIVYRMNKRGNRLGKYVGCGQRLSLKSGGVLD